MVLSLNGYDISSFEPGGIGFLHLIKLMPASLNTPMVFEWKK